MGVPLTDKREEQVPDNTSIKESLLALVNKQLLLARQRGPSHESGQTVLQFRRLWTAAVHALDELAQGLAAPVGLTAKEVAQLATTLEALVALLGENVQGYVKTAAQVAVGRREGVLYSLESRRCSAEVWEIVSMIRTMLKDVLEPNDPDAGPTRDAFAVGQAVRWDSPVEVLRVAEQHHAAFHNPVLAAHLEDHGVPVAVLSRKLASRRGALDAALNAGPAQHLADLRRQRDDHAMRVEIVSARIMVTISALFGRAKRAEFRALMPVRRRPRRTLKQDAQRPGVAVPDSEASQPVNIPVKDGAPMGTPADNRTAAPSGPSGSRPVTLLMAGPARGGERVASGAPPHERRPNGVLLSLEWLAQEPWSPCAKGTQARPAGGPTQTFKAR